MADALTTYKLIVLYMLSRVDFPLTNAQVAEFILDKGYTNYFTLQQVLSELQKAEFITPRQVRNSTHYSITDAGLETLEYFGKNISEGILTDIDTFLAERKYRLRSENETIADYYQEKNDLFIVRCTIKENQQLLMEIQLSVTTKEQAAAICDSFTKKNSDIYAHLMNELLFNR